MGRKKKDKTIYDPNTTKEFAAEDSPEVIEAQQTFEKEQEAAITDLMDDSPGPEAEPKVADPAEEKPSEKPAEKEPDSQPTAAKEPEPGKEIQTKAEETPPGKPAEPQADVPDSKPTKEPKAKETEEPKSAEFVAGDRFGSYTVEVVTDDGAKAVPLGNLVTTYQQFGHLQRRYQEVKPLFDLVEKANVRISDTLPLLELGIQTYSKQQGIIDGKQPPVAESKPATDGYQGPFNDAEQDAYFLEVDPDHHAAMHRLWERATGGGEVAKLRSEINDLKQSAIAAPAADNQKQEQVQKAFDDKILAWSGDHTDYFTAANIGEARLNAFKNFIIRSHSKSGLKIKELTPEFLAAEFARFDPRYNLEYMKKLAGKKAADGKSESGMFAEGSGMRTQAEPLTDQQKHMSDMF